MNGKLSALITAVSLAVVLTVVLPLQTFIPNASNYDFGLCRLLFGELLIAAALAALLYLVLRVSNKILSGYLTPLAIALLICVYLESGPLSFGIPELNGELPKMLDDNLRRVLDGIVWLVILFSSLFTYRWTRSWLHWLGAAICAISMCSLLDVHADREKIQPAIANGSGSLELADDLIEAVEYSPTRNVLMFVLDSMPASTVDKVLDANPEIKDHFTGFTAYNNNIGMHARTRVGVPGIMTGIYYEDGQDFGGYMMSSLGTNAFLQAYRDRGDAIYCMLDFMAYGFVDRDLRSKRPDDVGYAGLMPVLWRDSTEIPCFSLGTVSAFRLIPFAFKDAFLTWEMRARRVRGGKKNYDREDVLNVFLATRPVSENSRQMLAKFHTHGLHGPYTKSTAAETVVNCFQRLAFLMDVYRDRGLYDKSFIVIAADHGSDQIEAPAGEDKKASALLWVKPDNSRAPFREVTIPTSHSKIAALMKRAASGALSSAEVESILYTKERLYRRYFREDHACRDWIYHEDGTVDSPKQ